MLAANWRATGTSAACRHRQDNAQHFTGETGGMHACHALAHAMQAYSPCSHIAPEQSYKHYDTCACQLLSVVQPSLDSWPCRETCQQHDEGMVAVYCLADSLVGGMAVPRVALPTYCVFLCHYEFMGSCVRALHACNNGRHSAARTLRGQICACVCGVVNAAYSSK